MADSGKLASPPPPVPVAPDGPDDPGNFVPSGGVEAVSLVSISDRDLIRQCRAGATEAFGVLVERHQDRLYASLVRILGSAEDAREAVQDAFVHAYQKLDSFQGNAAFSTWLFRIAINAAFSRQRRARRYKASLDGARGGAGYEPADPRPDADPSQPLEQSETQRIVREALAALPEEYRTALVLKEMEGFRYEEIAEIVGVPIGTVRSRIHRARQELREKLRIALKGAT
jgi:RNA polymerase sigma-70 factor (ECF subfamily)